EDEDSVFREVHGEEAGLPLDRLQLAPEHGRTFSTGLVVKRVRRLNPFQGRRGRTTAAQEERCRSNRNQRPQSKERRAAGCDASKNAWPRSPGPATPTRPCSASRWSTARFSPFLRSPSSSPWSWPSPASGRDTRPPGPSPA